MEASTHDVKEHSLSHGLPKHCLAYECSVEVTNLFSQREHFDYSQLSVETFAFATDDDWEIDYHRKELIRHHKTLRSQLFKISGSKSPTSFDDL